MLKVFGIGVKGTKSEVEIRDKRTKNAPGGGPRAN
jgi:hypothetical protein